MEAQVLLDKYFETAFSAPDGVKKLRELILSLAMQGKLVPQDPNDQPASGLLKEIEAEKERLIKEGKIKKPKPLPEITSDEIPYDLPDSWEWVKLGNIAIFENGDRSSKYPNESDLKQTGVPFFGAKDMVNGVLSFTNELRFISESKFSELSNGKLLNNDFVLLLRGSVGKTAIFLANDCFSTGFINAQMLIIRLLNQKICDFFSLYSSSLFFQSLIESNVTGSAVRQMPANKVVNFLFPLPPFKEQQRIVEKIGRLMEQCDRLEKLREEHHQKRLIIHTAARDRLLNSTNKNSLNQSWNFIQNNFGELYSVKENVRIGKIGGNRG